MRVGERTPFPVSDPLWGSKRGGPPRGFGVGATSGLKEPPGTPEVLVDVPGRELHPLVVGLPQSSDLSPKFPPLPRLTRPCVLPKTPPPPLLDKEIDLLPMCSHK